MIVVAFEVLSPPFRERLLALGKKVPLGVLTAGEEGPKDMESKVLVEIFDV